MEEKQNVSGILRNQDGSKFSRFQLFFFTIIIMTIAFIIINSIILISYFRFESTFGGLNSIVFIFVLFFAVLYSTLGIYLFLRHKKKPIHKAPVISLWILTCLLIGASFALRILFFSLVFDLIFVMILCILELMLSLMSMVAIIVHLVRLKNKLICLKN
ncbi:MAG: hypothetical protein FWH03_06765 [Firmicutes bacterium]|nr:hypothetical protein [Bacillota bacterium]